MAKDSRLSVNAKQQLVVTGDGPISATFTIKLAKALMELPPMTVDGSLSIGDVMRRLTPTSRRSFETIVTLDSKLQAKFATLKDAFASINDPSKPKWTLKLEDIVEELFVDCAPVMVIIFTTDGERLISPSKDNYSKIMTFEEFEVVYGRSVRDHVHAVAATRITALKRALQLIDTETPAEYSLDVCLENMAMTTKVVKVYSEDQIHLFADRQKISIMNSTQTKKG